MCGRYAAMYADRIAHNQSLLFTAVDVDVWEENLTLVKNVAYVSMVENSLGSHAVEGGDRYLLTCISDMFNVA